jgi:hypothetical protein
MVCPGWRQKPQALGLGICLESSILFDSRFGCISKSLGFAFQFFKKKSVL